MFADAQGSNTSKSTAVACPNATNELLQKRREISVVSFLDPRNFFKGPARDKSVLWKVHLALQLVKHPELDQRQLRVILDAISRSSPELFTISNYRSAQKTKADHALESLKVRRSVRLRTIKRRNSSLT